jgi:hypothetical protein
LRRAQNPLHLLIEFVIFRLQVRLDPFSDFSERVAPIVVNLPDLLRLVIAQQQFVLQSTHEILDWRIGKETHPGRRRTMSHHRHAKTGCAAANENHCRQQNRRPSSRGNSFTHDYRLTNWLIDFRHGTCTSYGNCTCAALNSGVIESTLLELLLPLVCSANVSITAAASAEIAADHASGASPNVGCG